PESTQPPPTARPPTPRFPTRRSSDLERARLAGEPRVRPLLAVDREDRGALGQGPRDRLPDVGVVRAHVSPSGVRSAARRTPEGPDRKSTRLNSSHVKISYAALC